jgi:hypothetical protein
MANALYGLGRNKFANGDIDWVNDTIKLYLIDSADYTVNIDVDEYADDIASAAKVATATLAGNSTALGVVDANDTTFTSVTGDVSEAIVIWKDTAVQSTSPLIAYMDTGSGLPVTPNGGDITVTWDSGANKIFKL